MHKKIAIVGLSAGLVGGGAAGFALTSATTGAGAQTQATTTTIAPNQPANGGPDRGQHLSDVLAPLVKDGTITQSQADKVIAALEAAGPMDGHGRGGPGGPGDH